MKAYSHGTQVEYCFTNSNMVRIYIEHWHGPVTNFSSSQVNMTITVDGVATTMNVPASGYVHATPQSMLPDCSAPTVQLSECTAVADTEENWAFFDFPAPQCYTSLVIRVNSVIDPSFVLLECGAGRGGPIYPAETPVLTIEDEFPPFIVCPEELGDIEIDCGDDLPEALEIDVIAVSDDCTAKEDLVFSVSETTTGSNCAGPTVERTYSFTDELDQTTTCVQVISTALDVVSPSISCPSNLILECGDPANSGLITNWLASATATDDCGDADISNSYDPTAFAGIDNGTFDFNTNSVYNLSSAILSPLAESVMLNTLFRDAQYGEFCMNAEKGMHEYDKIKRITLQHEEQMINDFSDLHFVDEKLRIIPHWIDEKVDGDFANIFIRIPELHGDNEQTITYFYGNSLKSRFVFSDVFKDESQYDAFKNERQEKALEEDISEKAFIGPLEEELEVKSEHSLMTCDCVASQGDQEFEINAIQNAEDAVSFYSFGNPNGASANTGLEMNDAVVLFLYENTLTGEISLFIIIDGVRGGNGGAGSIDFFCLPPTATLDLSDDPGEISGIFPTVTANWRWADCCTDGALIGNVGCDNTFDFFPDFSSGIDDIKWVSGTLAAPVYHTFDSIDEPVRITCGDSQPSCCPNENMVDITNVDCPGDMDGAIDVTVDPASAPYTFEWSTGATTEDISGLTDGDYTVTITDDNDCEQISTFTVEANNQPSLNCPATIEVEIASTSVDIQIEDLGITVDNDCDLDFELTCEGCGVYECDDDDPSIRVILTDEIDNESFCTVMVTLKNDDPTIVCPSNLLLECGDAFNAQEIDSWLESATVEDPEGGVVALTTNYDPIGFAFKSDSEEENIIEKVSGKQSIKEEPKDSYYSLAQYYMMMEGEKGSQLVTFTATDECGNTATCNATITITDTTPPTITCPEDITVECGDPNNDAITTTWLGTAHATDNCTNEVTISDNYTVLSRNVCGGTVTVTFTADDGCRTSANATCTSNVTIDDTTEPEFMMKPQNIVFECDGSGNIADINAWLASNGGGMATDDCDNTVTWTSALVGPAVDGCGNNFTQEYIFTITDDCGNTVSANASVTTEDTTPPVITLRWEELIQVCTANNETNLAGYLETNLEPSRIADVCSADEDIDFTWILFNDSPSCGGTIDRTYLYTAIDECGNTSTAYFHYATTDAGIPTWADVPGTLFLECGDPDNPTIIEEWIEKVEESMFDACGGTLDITHNWDGSIESYCNSSTVVSWTVTDECGNSRVLNRTIRVRDLTNPVFLNCPEDFTVNVDVNVCGSNVIFSTPIPFDQCTDQDDIVIAQITGPASGSTFPVGTTPIRFRATDECNRRVDCEFSITVVDSEIPSIQCPSNVEVCTSDGICTWRSDDSVLATTTEACAGNLQVEITGATTLTRRNGTAQNRTFNLGVSEVCYYYTDRSDNEVSCCFDVIVEDCEDPEIRCPIETTVECDGAGNAPQLAAWIATARADDNCDDFELSNVAFNTISACGAGSHTVYQFTAEDPAGNVATCLASFIIEDTTEPLLTVPTDITIDCATMMNSILSDEDEGDDGGESGETSAGTRTACFGTTVSYTPTDGMAFQSLPFTADLGTCECSYDASGTLLSQLSGAEPCPISVTGAGTFNLVFTLATSMGGGGFCPYGANIELSETLGSGPSSDDPITVFDWANLATATDICGAVTITNDYRPDRFTESCSGSQEVTFTATDECGNVTLATATVHLEDQTPPEVVCPEDITLECGDVLNDAVINLWLNSFTASDNCSDMTIAHDFPDAFTEDCGSTGAYNVTFSATDECDQETTCEAMIIIDDTLAPVFLIKPQDLIVECGDGEADPSEWLKNNGGAIAEDQCDTDLVWSVVEGDSAESCGDSEEITFTFTVTDDCGNSTSATAQFIFEDTTPPTVVPPADITVECGDAAATSITDWQDGASATDNCGDGFTFEAILFNTVSGCGDSFTEVYQFTATDACGNQGTALASYTIEDTTEPAVTCPVGLAIECGIDNNPQLIASWLLTASGSDDCGVVDFENNYTGLLPSNCGGSLTVTFTGTDACGNTSTCMADITMNDTTQPDIVNCPQDVTVNVDVDVCGSNPIFSTPFAIDNCDVTVAQTAGPVSGTTFPVGTTAIEFTATDECGNTDVCQFNITVVDSDIPLIACPPGPINVCTDPGTCTWLGTDLIPILGVENCPDYTITYSGDGVTSLAGSDDASGETFNQGVTVLCYEIEDQSGNTASCCVHVTVLDCENPSINCPADQTFECDGAGNAADLTTWLANATSTDNCDSDLAITSELFNSISDCGGGGTSVYEFTVTDQAANQSTCLASFTIEDTTPPTLIDAAEDLRIECEGGSVNSAALTAWLNNNGGATASDICSEVTWSHDFAINSLTDRCGRTGSRNIVFTATDECGNSISSEALFRIEDNTAPVINCPLPIVLECGDAINDAAISNWLSSANATDECSDVVIVNDYDDTFVVTCGNAGVYTVEYTATDACDNTSTCESTITIEDTTNPEISIPAVDMIVECADPAIADALAAWLKSNGGALASDACDETLAWSFEALDPSPDCGSNTSTTYIFTVVDDCGNESTTTASFITEDTTPPIIAAPENLMVECDGAGNNTDLVAWLETVDGIDDCGAVTTSYELFNTISGCGSTNTMVYQFTSTDECGNTASALAEFEIVDTIDPIITCPVDLVLECGAIGNDQAIAAWLLDATATDICGQPAITHNYTGLLPADCEGSMTITFIATDECGNTHTCMADIIMDDTIDPVFVNCPVDDLVINVDVDNCSSNPIFSTPVADDNCTVSVEQTAGLSSGTEFPLGSTAIEFTATDGCGNEVVCQFNIIVVDSDIPTILCPSTTVEACVDAGGCTWNAEDIEPSLGLENCPGFTITYEITGATTASGVNDASGEDFVLGESTVCYTIIDGSDNEQTCCFKVLVTDCENPELECPNDLIVECAAANTVQLSTWLNLATGSDNCDNNVEITTELNNTISGCGNTQTEVYQFTATDEFGNTTTCLRSFEIQDNTAPVITTAEPNVTVECDGLGNTAQFISWLEDNGNIADTDIDEFCNDFTWANNFESVAFTTNASCNDDIGYYEVAFWVIDDCGNESNKVTKQFIIEDTEPPELIVPADITLECGDANNDAIIEAWLANIGASDLCDNDVTIEILVETNGECGLIISTDYTITATDDCGNDVEKISKVTVEDTTSPTIEVEAQDLLLECADPNNENLINAWLVNNGGAVASDVCSADLTWTFEAGPPVVGCGATANTVYTFTVTDDCDNESITTANVIVEDTTPPELVVPDDQVEECGDIAVSLADWIAEATSTDECGEVTINAILWNTISGCGGTNTEVYQFTATDACGNETIDYAEYDLEDTELPTIVCPEDLVLECGDENNDQLIIQWLSMAIATDENDCSDVTITHDYPGGLPDPLSCNDGLGIDVTFTATDECGNEIACTANISMNDTENPYWLNCPNNLIVNVDIDLCESRVVYSVPVAVDNCDEDVTVTQTEGPAPSDIFPLGTTSVTFISEDECGNFNICSFNITVLDSDIPSIDCPSNDVVKCADEGTCTWLSDDSTDPLINDNCPGLVVTYTVTGETTATSAATGVNTIAADGVVFNLGVSEICYTISDPAGNSSSCCFDVVIEDCDDPTIICSDQLDIACGEEDLDAWFTLIAATATDNCNTNAELSIDTTLITDFSSCGSTFERVYQFTVTDETGNSSTCLATYETDDTASPVITEASNLTLECNGTNQSTALQGWLNNNGGATFTSDNCNEDVVWTNNFVGDLIIDCGASGEVEVMFTATDDCGNISTTMAIFKIEDTTAPIIECPADIVIECTDPLTDAITESWLNGASAIDACDGTLAITNNYGDDFAEDCGMTGVHTVTWTTQDACANISICEGTITIIDTTDPTIEIEATDLILECAEDNVDSIDAWIASNGGSVASDACSDPLVWAFTVAPVLEDCGNTGSTLFTFTVTDDCGNSSSTSARVILEDTTVPVLTVPEDQVEECGNIAVTVEDWIAEATATDACGEVTIDAILWNTVSGCGGADTETYRFTATDDCGNETIGFAVYEIEDTSEPTIVCPPNLEITCGNESNDQIIIQWLASATATDEFDCSDINITNEFPNGLPADLVCNAGEGIDIIFTATDACDNFTTCTATITMDDTEEPFFQNCPQDLVVNVDVDLCENRVVYSTPVAFDNCDENPLVSRIEGPASGDPFPLGTTTVTFEVEDVCGNINICSFDITVIDSDVPSIDCPSNDVNHCVDEDSCAWTSDDSTDPIFNDNCPGLIVTYTVTGATEATSAVDGINRVAEDGVIFNLGTSEICYNITDPAGNTSSCCFDVIITDCQDPVITCSDEIDIACGEEDLSTWFTNIAATATDNCDANVDLTVDTLLLTDFSSCGITFERVYQFTVTDQAGNFSNCIATYETDDTEPPVISEASDLILECDGSNQSTALQGWLNNNGGATFTSDNCSEDVTWSNNFVGDLSDDCGATGEVEVVFTATDACGNFSTVSAIFRIIDTVAPVIECPEDVVIECSNDLTDAIINSWLSNSSAIDACEGAVAVTNNYAIDAFTGACGNTGSQLVTWTTVDACGNTETCSATVIIEDNTPPSIDREAADLVLECADPLNAILIAGWEENNGGADASDGCSEPLTWTFAILPSLGSCGEAGATTYIYTVTDDCGNSSTTSAQVIIEDTTPPILVVPENQIEECEGILVDLTTWQAEATATDACGEVTIEVILFNTISGCGDGDVNVYEFTATDACGNITQDYAEYGIEDRTQPVITAQAGELVVACDGFDYQFEILQWLNDNGGATATDGCGELTWSNDYGEIGSGCGGTGEVLITFTVSDPCGNSASTSAAIMIIDEEAPEWEILPQDLEIACDGSGDPKGQIESWLLSAGGADVEDNCSLVVFAHDYEEVELECNQQGSVVVTFTATDACGNSTTATANLSITDDVPPVITSPAQDETVECNGEGNVEQLQAWLDRNGGATSEDACGAITWNTPVLSETVPACGGTLTHTYIFTSTDPCGNISNNTIASFHIVDEISPFFVEFAKDLTVECDGAGNEAELKAWLDNHAGATADDICSNPITWAYDLVKSETTCDNTTEQVFRFTITDDCGNTEAGEATFIIEDTTSPTIVAGEDMNMEECESSITGNFPDFDFWLSDNAGATVSDICGTTEWSNDFHPDNWVTTCGDTRFVDVTFTATDGCGNSSSTVHRFGVGDVTAPTFTNCPRPPVVADAPEGWCSSFVNFSPIDATDNCQGDVVVNQIDETGFISGDLFPVGLTILVFEAVDACGNRDTCELKVVVNDFHTPPTIACPEDIIVQNDFNMCGAVVDNIPPTYEDNCPENTAVIFEAIDENGELVACGFEDASGVKFPSGMTTVSYTVIDQPILLITEIIQNDTFAGVEITNFGPASLDISCLIIGREGAGLETYDVPNGVVLAVGETYTQTFSNIGSGVGAGYYISFLDRFIDGVSINGHVGASYPFSGSISAENIYRTTICDHDLATDFVPISLLNPSSYGLLNPGLQTMSSNNSVVGLQGTAPNTATCDFKITVIEDQVPQCAQHDSTTYVGTYPIVLAANECTPIDFAVSNGLVVGDINLYNVVGSIEDAGELDFYLRSPAGTIIDLLFGACEGTSDFDLGWDDTQSLTLDKLLCSPLGLGDAYIPQQSLKSFFAENPTGIWSLIICNNGDTDGSISNAELEVLSIESYVQTDTLMSNDEGFCGAEFTWTHPIFFDNCCDGDITVDYVSDQGITTPVSADVNPGHIVTQYFEVGTTTVVYTLKDAAGNESTCSFDVNILDDEDPVIPAGACQDIIIQLTELECRADITPLLPSQLVADNCGGEMLANLDQPELYELPPGVHPVTLVYSDGIGNETSCTMNVTVLAADSPTSALVCAAQINLSLGASCESEITAGMMLPAANQCLDDYCVTVFDENGDIVEGNIVGVDHIGQNLSVTVCESCDSGANCCWGNVLVEYKAIPEFDCPADTIVVCNQNIHPDSIGYPVFTTCVQGETIMNFDDEFIRNDNCDDILAQVNRSWTIFYNNGQQLDCKQTIQIKGFDLNDIEFPADMTVDNGLNCDDVTRDPGLTHPDSLGYPTINGVSIVQTGEGLCMHSWNWEDQILYHCKGSYEILRKWSVRNMCEPINTHPVIVEEDGTIVAAQMNPIEHYQIINVIDTQGPEFASCPQDITISTSAGNCYASFDLKPYLPEITDICGEIKELFISVDGGAVVANSDDIFDQRIEYLECGTHTVKIRARDWCSNTSECSFDITVEDRVAPIMICEGDLLIAITDGGETHIPAETFNDGSYDNCGNILFEVYRLETYCDSTDLVPGEFVSFCCADEGRENMVVLRAWDDSNKDFIIGNEGDLYGECMIRVEVSNKIPPRIVCPPAVTLNCEEDYTDVSLTGMPEVISTCQERTATFSDRDIQVNNCGVGTLIRVWTVDNFVPPVNCQQQISLEFTGSFAGDSIVWPEEITVNCLDEIPDLQAEISSRGACDLVGVNLVSDTFDIDSDACFKIFNNWTVINWCIYDANAEDPDGIWEYTQVVKVVDDIAPEITSCEDLTFPIVNQNCEQTEINLSATAVDNSCSANQSLFWDYAIDLNSDGIIDSTGTASGASTIVTLYNVSIGNHNVVWSVRDGCGNSSSCTQTFEVRDGKAPAAYCLSGLSTNVDVGTGTVEIWAKDFDNGSSDDCHDQSELEFSFSGTSIMPNRAFTCDDLNGADKASFDLEVWIWDPSGNKDFCRTTLEVSDNTNACDGATGNGLLADIAGNIKTPNGLEIIDVEVYLSGAQAAVTEVDLTNAEGHYIFDDNEMSKNYRLVPLKDKDHAEGLSSSDLVLLQRHVLGINSLTDPYLLIAADVNNDGRVSATDLISLRNVIMGISAEFPNNTSWKFMDAKFEMTMRDIYNFPDRIDIQNIAEDVMDNDFVGIKIGDINASFSNLLSDDIQSRERTTMTWLYEVEHNTVEDPSKIIVSADKSYELSAFQMKINLGVNEFLGFDEGAIKISPENYHLVQASNGSILTISWTSAAPIAIDKGQQLFSIKTNHDTEDQIRVSLEPAKTFVNEVYVGQDLEEYDLDLTEKVKPAEGMVLYQNEPNPFVDETQIRFSLPQKDRATLSIFDITGKLVFEEVIDAEVGMNTYKLDRNILNSSSVFIYKVKTKKFSEQKSLITINN